MDIVICSKYAPSMGYALTMHLCLTTFFCNVFSAPLVLQASRLRKAFLRTVGVYIMRFLLSVSMFFLAHVQHVANASGLLRDFNGTCDIPENMKMVALPF